MREVETGSHKIEKRSGVKAILSKISHLLENVTKTVCGVLLFIMVISVLAGVYYRFVLVNPLPWVEEVSVYSMIWLGCLSASIVYKYRQHPRIDILFEKFPKKIQIGIQFILEALVAIFLIIIFYNGLSFAEKGLSRKTGSLGISMMIPYLAISVGCLLTLLQQVMTIIIDGVLIAERTDQR
ncbi:MAG: TRAP transporter small permease [Halanaerobiales bacterium]|nr:TRAP transporter small permease [Halanaerobiales bacterium]